MPAQSKNQNYTPEMMEKLVSMYKELGNEGLEDIAEELNKPVRSIRSKLVREGVYVASAKVSTKVNGPSKKELLRDIEAEGFDASGFEGATKTALSRLLGIISN